MFHVTIYDLDPKEVRRIIYGLDCAGADSIEKEKTSDGDYNISFYCKVVCYMKTPSSHLLTVNNETVELKRYNFSFISIS